MNKRTGHVIWQFLWSVGMTSQESVVSSGTDFLDLTDFDFNSPSINEA